MTSRYHAALAKDRAVLVGMDEFKAVVFSSNTPCIITKDLNGCSSILIVSSVAAILGHVAPRSHPTEHDLHDPQAGERHTEAFMAGYIRYFRTCRDQNLFPKSDSLVVCCMSGDEIGLPDQQRIMRLFGLISLTFRGPGYPHMRHDLPVIDQRRRG
ncbi:hypothetical protein M011DRAFT_506543 [Sporormia fimetaria CBS 119925]|uniref:Uncharacterized protein n=1 Tax=Sporormia fimetaria CBS 119925 TaxID=1340428 RepID=A0A6A6V560_9PLEO|nr:hypothetical protein M011DRAFT_506543 [Sporormia fimetaria CBS 119925]